MAEPLFPKPPTNKWDVLKVGFICVAACFIANAVLASDLSDLSEVRGGGFGAILSIASVAVARRAGWL